MDIFENEQLLTLLSSVQILKSTGILQGMLSENTQKMYLYFSEISPNKLDETRIKLNGIEKNFCILDKLLAILSA